MTLRCAAAALLVLLLAAAPAVRAEQAPLALSSCRLAGLEHDALCGVLRRPLDPSRPAGTQIDLHVAVLPAVARRKQPDAAFFFAGGPGQGAIGLAGTVERLLSRLGARRDIVLIDQRGTGRSAPLRCDSPPPDEALARVVDHARLVAAIEACRRQLEHLPAGDLRFYTTSIAMADADAVRAALRMERIDLVGASYGTRAALEYLRLYPARVRRVVLDGVAPPDMALPESFDVDGQAALDALFAGCAAEPACARAHPELARTWQRLLASMPRATEVAEPSSGRRLAITLTREALPDLVRPGLYSPTLGALLPHAIEEAAAGRFDVLVALGSAFGGSPSGDVAEGEHFSVVCSEDLPRLKAVATTDGTSASRRLYRDVCAQWPRGEVPASFYTVPVSRAPVLLLSGGLDPVTPPRHAERVARALGAQARSVVVRDSGHGVSGIACMRDAIFRFIDAPTDGAALAVETGCAASIPRPFAFQPVRPARGAAAADDRQDVQEPGQLGAAGRQANTASRPVDARGSR